MRIKTGLKRDGTIVAREVEVYYNAGAYADRSGDNRPLRRHWRDRPLPHPARESRRLRGVHQPAERGARSGASPCPRWPGPTSATPTS